MPTSANGERTWHACSYHNPETVTKVAAVPRFYHDCMLALPGGDGRTPAMRLGLARGKVHPRDLIGHA